MGSEALCLHCMLPAKGLGLRIYMPVHRQNCKHAGKESTCMLPNTPTFNHENKDEYR